MTLLHQAAQKAVEALTGARAWLNCERTDVTMRDIDAAIAAVQSALQQQREPVASLTELIDKLDGYLNSPEQIALRDELLAALQHQEEPPPECKTEEEKRAFAFGWWKAMEANRARSTGAYAFGVQEVPREPVALNEGVPDAEAAMAYALKRWGYRQGTKECIAFYRGACWCALAAAPSTPEKAGGVSDGVGGNDGVTPCSLCASHDLCKQHGCAGKALERERAARGVSASGPHPLPAQHNDGGEQ